MPSPSMAWRIQWERPRSASAFGYNDLWDNETDYAGDRARRARPVGRSRVRRCGARVTFHLRPDSALVDAGDDTFVPAHDFEGEPRPVSTVMVTACSRFDIGADELWPGLTGSSKRVTPVARAAR